MKFNPKAPETIEVDFERKILIAAIPRQDLCVGGGHGEGCRPARSRCR